MSKFENVIEKWIKKKELHLSDTGWSRVRTIRRELESGKIDASTAISQFLAGVDREIQREFDRHDIADMEKDLR